ATRSRLQPAPDRTPIRQVFATKTLREEPFLVTDEALYSANTRDWEFDGLHAATGPSRYSWWRPPRTDFATTQRAFSNSMTPSRLCQLRGGTVGNAGPQARTRPTPVVVCDPLLGDASEVTLVQRNHQVQELSPHRANQSFAERIRLQRLHGRLEDRQAHCRDGSIDLVGVDAVVVMNEKSARCPTSPYERVARSTLQWDVPSHSSADLSSADLQHYGDVEHAASGPRPPRRNRKPTRRWRDCEQRCSI